MLKKMRWRFIGAAMAAFSAVVLVLLCVINMVNYVNITRLQDETLNMLVKNEQEDKPPAFDDNFHGPGPLDRMSPETQYMLRFFTVHTDQNDEVTRVNQDHIASVSKEDAVTYATNILHKGSESGYLKGYRYQTAKTSHGNVIVFLNSERELQSIRSLLVVTASVAVFCLAAVFILVMAFSKRAIAPYVRNIETQKQFITDAGHELKTPLTAISTSADVLAMDEENNEWVQNIQMQSRRMSKLIADLVTLSRLDEEKPFPDTAEFALSEAVWEISEPFSALAQAKGKRYEQNIEDNLNFNGDKNAIQQMISILLDNALKYSDEGGEILVNVHKKQHKTEITVSNTCNDKELKNPERLFDRFYRAENARSNRDSYGLGLSIAKSIAEHHGGSIKVEMDDRGRIRFVVEI